MSFDYKISLQALLHAMSQSYRVIEDTDLKLYISEMQSTASNLFTWIFLASESQWSMNIPCLAWSSASFPTT